MPEQEPRLTKTWEVSAFDRVNNEWTTTLNHAFDHTPDELADLVPISTAAPTRITPTKRVKPSRHDEVSVIIPDIQIGWHGDEPFHDERAMSLAQIAIRELQPDNVVFLGDSLDLPSLSRYEQRPAWQQTVQQSVDRFHSYLAQTRANAPDAKIVSITGNHEDRFRKAIMKNNAELLGLKQAGSEGLGVLTLEHLLRLGELEVQHVDGYPNGRYFLEDNLQAMHGYIVRGGGRTAAAVANREDVSTLFGHIHRIEKATRTIPSRNGARFVMAASFGTLARIGGHVPGRGFATDENEEVVSGYDNWQQGFGVVQHNTHSHQVDQIHIEDGSFNLYGERYFHE